MTLSKSGKVLLLAGAILAALGVVIGAFGAHSLPKLISTAGLEAESEVSEHIRKRVANWETGARYQMYHAIGLMIAGFLSQIVPRKLCVFSGWSFAMGILLFSGSLYLLALTNTKWLGAIAPIGGTAFILGWLALAIAISKAEKTGSSR